MKIVRKNDKKIASSNKGEESYDSQMLERNIGILGNECNFLVKIISCFKNEVLKNQNISYDHLIYILIKVIFILPNGIHEWWKFSFSFRKSKKI